VIPFGTGSTVPVAGLFEIESQMPKPIREARLGFALTATTLGLLVSVVDPAGRLFNLPDAVTGPVKGLLLCAAAVMAIFAVRQLRRFA
jgi:hypothetical protein